MKHKEGVCSMNDLFVKSVHLQRDGLVFDEYPFCVEAIRQFESLTFEKSLSFLIGENGIGKSTFIEALAVALRLNAEGGTQNFHFHTKETHSNLYQYLKVVKGTHQPQTKFFLRAESFYNVASQLDKIADEEAGVYDSYGGTSLHACSHGESFMQLMMNRFGEKGLYILDEPEAALSPSRQLALLVLIDELAEKGSQFILSTHSPILLSYQKGIIYDLNHDFHKVSLRDTEIYQTYKLVLDNPERMQYLLFGKEE